MSNNRKPSHLGIESCCCLDLRTGGLVIGYIGLVLSILDLLTSLHTEYYWVLDLLCVWLNVCWVYGIHTKRTIFMLPNLVLSVIEYGFCLAVLAIIPVIAVGFHAKIIAATVENSRIADKLHEQVWAVAIAVLFFWAILTGFIWFLTAVQYSLYQQMNRNINGENGAVAASTNIELNTVTSGVKPAAPQFVNKWEMV